MPLDEPRAAVYAPFVTGQVFRLLSSLDRESHSVSYGSFDREHWSWMFRDFPITMLQATVYPVALLWRFPFPDNPLYQNARVHRWIEAALRSVCQRQHRNGAFDSVAPYTQDHGVTLAMVYVLTETARFMGDELSPELRTSIRQGVQAGCTFAVKSEEDYAFISNHQALFALAFLNSAELIGHDGYRDRGAAIINRIIHHQSTEGWYQEYDGADPGYESLGISYLAKYWSRTGSTALLDSLRRSVAFYAHFIHPDGSVGGVYGSRHTSLYFPAGFELLAREVPISGAIARFMRARLAWQNVVTPAISDAENLAPLAYTYLEACLTPAADASTPPLLPCEVLDGTREYPQAGLSVVGTERYYAVVNSSRGGVCRIFDKHSARIAYEDAGYIARAGAHRWTSQLTGLGRRRRGGQADQISCMATFAEVKQELPTPAKYLVLRVLNLTVFRSLTLGALVRRLIIGRLITRKRRGPLGLSRSIAFGTRTIDFQDRLELLSPMLLDEVALAREFTGIHMGSAKYAHPSELEITPEAPADGLAEDLNRRRHAVRQFRLEVTNELPWRITLDPPTDDAPVNLVSTAP